MKKIWIVSEVFYPETVATAYIMTEIAKYLALEYNVNVISGPAFYNLVNQNNDEDINLDGVNIIRTSNKGYNKNSIISRVIGSFMVSYKMLVLSRKEIPNNSEILLVTNPAVLVFLMSLIKRIKKWKINILVHDVFPENLIATEIIKSEKNIFYIILRYMINISYKRMDHLIVIGRDMKELMVKKIKKTDNITIIENWSDTDLVCYDKPEDRNVSLIYAGNMGRAQGLDSLLGAIKDFQYNRLKFIFIGNGHMDEFINNYISENNLTNISKLDWVEREEQNSIYKNIDIGIVTLKKGMYGLGVPSKFYNLISAGKPIFYIGDLNSEIHLLIKKYNIGWYAESGSNSSIRKALKEIQESSFESIKSKSINSRELAEKTYSKGIILNKFAEYFKNNEN